MPEHQVEVVHAVTDQVLEGVPLKQEPEASEDQPQLKKCEDQAQLDGAIDFSRVDFSKISDKELEELYIASINRTGISKGPQIQPPPSPPPTPTQVSVSAAPQPIPPLLRRASSSTPTTVPTPTNGLSYDNHPTAMFVHLEDINLHKPLKNVVVKFSFRHRKYSTGPGSYPGGHRETKFKFDVNYHALLFDHLKIDVYEAGFFGSHIGRVHCRLSRLPQVLGDIEHSYQLKHRKAHRNPKLAGKQIGEITIGFSFIGGRRQRPGRSQSMSSLHSSRNRSDSEATVDAIKGTPEQEKVADEFLEMLQEERRNGNASGLFSSSSSFDDSKSVISFKSTTSSGTTKSKKRWPSLLSENTIAGLKEFSEGAAALFGTGWKISKVEFVQAFLFLNKYYNKYHPNARTHDIVMDKRQLRVSCYFLNYSMTAYGSLILNYFGYGKGYARDFMRPKMDSKTAREHLGLKREDMLVWDFELKLFKPQYFVVRDPKLNAIIVVVRGTSNIHEVITDAHAEYETFSHGYAHRGFLRCAQWLEENLTNRIKGWVKQYNCNAVYLAAHSLGAGVASLFTMILCQHLDEFREISRNPKFALKCYNIATPPCVNAELCAEYEPYIETYVNENDIVPRASWGAILDFRDLIITSHNLMNEKGLTTQERMTRLAERHAELKQSNEHPKVYIPGKIFYIYKTSRVHSSTTGKPKLSDDEEFTGNPLIDDVVPHYLVERSRKELFGNLAFKTNFIFHHLPSKYDNGLRKVSNCCVFMATGSVD
ncbi:hypothetical protein BC832DRAFT_119316 [Gaertneriomyces semiglobifer]|nr:hypothetical protein BC832DRAFT_119316 [Gaertneriomyces semiglobifer]